MFTRGLFQSGRCETTPLLESPRQRPRGPFNELSHGINLSILDCFFDKIRLQLPFPFL